MRAALARAASVLQWGNYRLVTALWCSTILLCGTPDDRNTKAQIVKPGEIKARIGKRLSTSRNVEVLLRTKEVVAGAGVIVGPDSLELFSDIAKQRSIRVIDVRLIDELHFARRSRADRTLGGVLGALGGLVLGGLLAFGLGSAGYDEAALAALVVTPAAGAVAGVKLAGREGWERVVIRE